MKLPQSFQPKTKSKPQKIKKINQNKVYDRLDSLLNPIMYTIELFLYTDSKRSIFSKIANKITGKDITTRFYENLDLIIEYQDGNIDALHDIDDVVDKYDERFEGNPFYNYVNNKTFGLYEYWIYEY